MTNPTRWMNLLAKSHAGPCTWRTHPTHRARNWLVYLLGRVAP